MTASSTTESSMPRSDSGLRVWFVAFADVIAADPGRAAVTGEEAAELVELAEAYAAAFDLASDPPTRTAGSIADKDAARDRAVAAFRRIVSRIRADHRIPDTVKLALGINPPPRGPKPRVAAPTTAPLLSIVEAHPGRVIMRYADSATPESRSKPRGVQQLQLFIAIGPERTSDPEQAKYLAAYTRTPFAVPLRDEDDGQMATYFGRWSTRTALVGPWSEPVSMTVIGSGQGKPSKAPTTEGEVPVIEVKAGSTLPDTEPSERAQ